MTTKDDIEAAVIVWINVKTPDNFENVLSVATPYVTSVVSSIPNPIPNLVDIDDLVQAGLMGLMTSLNTYSPNMGTTFCTWAHRRIKGSAQDLVRKLNPMSRSRNVIPIPIDGTTMELEDTSYPQEDVWDFVISPDGSAVLREALRSLTNRQQLIFLMVLNGMKSKQVAMILDISTAKIQQERQTAITALSEMLSDRLDETVNDLQG